MIELLVVVAIVGLLAALSIPAFTSIGQARGVSEAAYQVAAAIEFARNEAISRQTFAWVGFQDQTNSGSRDLWVGMVYSKDGSTTNMAAANLQPMGRAFMIQRVGLVDTATLQVGTNLSSCASVYTNSGAAFTVGQRAFAGRTVTVTPAGEFMLASLSGAIVPTNGFDPKIAIGLRGFRGTTPVSDNDVAVVIDGSVGIPTIYRK